MVEWKRGSGWLGIAAIYENPTDSICEAETGFRGNALTQLHSVLIDRKTSSFGDHNDIVNELFGGSIYGSMGDRRILNTQVSGKLGIPVDLARMMRRGMRVVGMRMMMMRRVVGRMRRMRVEKKD